MTRFIALLITCEMVAPALLIGQTDSAGGAPQAAPQSVASPAKTGAPSRSANRNQRSQNKSKKQFQQSPMSDQPAPGPVDQQRVIARQRAASDRVRSRNPLTISFTQATQRQHHQRHDHNWWITHFSTIVFVRSSGYFYWDAGYWFPAYGYYPQYENFEYNGPIYTYGNLLPDQVIYNVQRALKELGYYGGALTGSLSGATQRAISAFQEDNDLEVTGAIDEPTVGALGLY